MKKTKVWTIYKHTLICDGPEKDWSYIGQTFKSVTSRWKNGTAYRDQPNFYTAIKNMAEIVLNMKYYLLTYLHHKKLINGKDFILNSFIHIQEIHTVWVEMLRKVALESNL